MRYLIFALVAFSALNANARPHCIGTCALIGPNIYETQTVSYFDDYLKESFHIDDLNGHKISGLFSQDGFGYCGKLTSVSVSVDKESYSWKDSEVIFNIDGVPHKFTCEYSNQTFGDR